MLSPYLVVDQMSGVDIDNTTDETDLIYSVYKFLVNFGQSSTG